MVILSTEAPTEIPHPVHPEHMLKLVATGNAAFECDGCREHGAGARYTCGTCNFDLHKDCALAEATLVHPLLNNMTFELQHEPPAPKKNRICDACGTRVLGFYYHCAKKGFDLHPCCAKLPMLIQHEDLKFDLLKDAYRKCNGCGGRGGVGTFWFYRSTCETGETVYLHVKCAKEIALRYRAGGGSNNADDDRLIPVVKETALTNYGGERAGSKFERICKMVAAVVHFFIAVIIGDPTPILAAVVPAVIGFLSNSTG